MSQKDQYEELGFTILRGFFDNEEIAIIDKRVSRIYQQWLSENEAKVFSNKLVNMHSLTSGEYFQGKADKRVEFFDLIASAKLAHALKVMFGSNIYFHNTQLFFNPSNVAKLPYWHRDMQYSPINDAVQREEQSRILSLHLRIPLVEEKGVELVRGTHKRWDTELERNVRFELNGHKNSDSLPDAELIDLAVGDVLIFNAQMIHRGNYALNITRKAFDLCVGKYHPLASAFLDKLVLPTAAELGFIKNSQWYKLARNIAAKGCAPNNFP